jgi:hypothetical protein
MRIRILVKLLSNKKLNFYIKNIQVGNRSKYIGRTVHTVPVPTKVETFFESRETWFICKFWSTSMLVDSQINADPDPQH